MFFVVEWREAYVHADLIQFHNLRLPQRSCQKYEGSFVCWWWTAHRFGPIPHSKTSRAESPFNVGSCLGPACQIGLWSSTALVLDKALHLDKVLDFWTIHPFQRTTSNFPTVRCWMVSWSDNHKKKHSYPTLCESVSVRMKRQTGCRKPEDDCSTSYLSWDIKA